ncbi:hypothetical protein B0H14DRAFT_2584864 [Mycena olivaceomarginata]|nr:hypothetical protein B0H14DRAFT_2584864 [Mycena olivaceomarginata]
MGGYGSGKIGSRSRGDQGQLSGRHIKRAFIGAKSSLLESSRHAIAWKDVSRGAGMGGCRSCVFKCAEGNMRRKNSSTLGWILRFRAALAMMKSRDNALVTLGARIELPATMVVEECLQKTAERRKGPILEQMHFGTLGARNLGCVDVVDETGETVVGDGAAEGTEKIEDDTGEIVDVDGVSGGTDEAVDAAGEHV